MPYTKTQWVNKQTRLNADNLNNLEGQYDAAVADSAPRTEALRISAATLPTWTRKRNLAALKQSPARVLCIGDSTTAGVYSNSYTTDPGNTNQGGPNSYPDRLAAALTAAGHPAVVGMAIPGHPGNEDSRWSFTGSTGYSGKPIGAGSNAGISLDESGRTATLKPNIKADTYVVYYYGDGGTGVISATATGGAPVTIDTKGASSRVYQSAPVKAAGVSADNSLTIAQTSGTSFVLGVEFYDSTNPNVIRVLPAGVGGSTSAEWADTASFSSRRFINAVAPDLSIVSLGLNDIGQNVPPATVLANAEAVLTEARNTGDAILMSAFPRAGASPVDTVNDLYRGTDHPYVDLAWRYGHDMVAWGLMTQDETHPNALGYNDTATVLADALSR